MPSTVTEPMKERVSDVLSSLVICGQCRDDTSDNPRAQEHPEVADAVELHGLHVGVGGHRPDAGHDHVEC
ncbi:MAG: hypothetical protein QOI90_492, partial [Mycobacterium sp.]|nr:hypothetical protein [Mycobacterium sp.]